MRNSGMGQGVTLLRKEVMSSRTRFVGPVFPFSAGFWTERPHPLLEVKSFSTYAMDTIPLIKSINFYSFGCKGGEEAIIGITYHMSSCGPEPSLQQLVLTMVAEAVYEYKPCFCRPFGLSPSQQSSPAPSGTLVTFHVLVYNFFPSSTVCQPSSTDISK